jgi:hypothetical protein
MITITIDVEQIVRFKQMLMIAKENGFRNAILGLRDGMEHLRRDWMEYVAGPPLNDNAYLKELAERRPIWPYRGDDLCVGVQAGRRGRQREQGASAWDMKPGLLAGREYRDIPFRHFTPQSNRYNAMPRDIYNPPVSQIDDIGMPNIKARDLPRHARYLTPEGKGMLVPVEIRGRHRAYRLRTTPMVDPESGTFTHRTVQTKLGIPVRVKPHQVHGPGRAMYIAGGEAVYKWQTGKYENMVRMVRKPEDVFTGRRVDSQYMTFRRVSVNSDPHSWWYPAIHAQPHIRMIAARNAKQIREKVAFGLLQDIGIV